MSHQINQSGKTPLQKYGNLAREYEDLARECQKENSLLSQITSMVRRKIERIEAASSGKKSSKTENKTRLLCDLVMAAAMQKNEAGRKMLEDYGLCEEFMVETEIVNRGYEQLSLPGCEPEKGTVQRKSKKVSARMFRKDRTFVKMKPVRSQAEVLLDLDTKWLNDLHKYMCTKRAGKARKELLSKDLAEWICTYPLHLLLALDEATVRMLRRLSEQAEGERLIIDEENVDACQKLAYFGLADLRVIWEGGELYFGISVTKEAEKILLPAWKEISRENFGHDGFLGYLDRQSKKETYSVKKLQEELEVFFDRIFLMLRYYGIVEGNEFYRIFCEAYQAEVSFDELMRFVYLRGTFHRVIRTGSNFLTGETFVALPEIDLDEVAAKRNKYCKDRDYPVSPEEKMAGEIQEATDLWRAVGKFFEPWEPTEDEIKEICCEGNRLVLNGSSVPEVMEYLNEWYAVDNPMDRTMLWRLVVMISLLTPLPMLKGYSRKAFYEAFGTYPYPDMFRDSDKRVRKASLCELPLSVQEKLAGLAVLSRGGNYFPMVSGEEELPKECRQNEEVKLYLFTNRIVAWQKITDPVLREREEKKLRDMAFALCEECRDSETADLILRMCNVSGIVSYRAENRRVPKKERIHDPAWEDGWEEYAVPEPVVKPAKIYPNDPCPCGSGKKYKKCCGRK